jgi:hypothetical protein
MNIHKLKLKKLRFGMRKHIIKTQNEKMEEYSKVHNYEVVNDRPPILWWSGKITLPSDVIAS